MPYSNVYAMVDNSEWQPDWVQLRQLLGFLDVNEIRFFTAYAGPLLWDVEGPATLSKASNITLEDAIASVSEKAVTVSLGCKFRGWARKLATELETVDQELSDGFVAWDLSLYLGPYSIPDRYEERTARLARFTISLGGDGSPTDNSEYLNVVRHTNAWKELADFVQNWAASRLSAYLVVG